MTLPESFIESVKVLTKAVERFAHEAETIQAFSATLQGHINQLIARPPGGGRLADINPTSKEPVPLPRAIVPDPVKNAV